MHERRSYSTRDLLLLPTNMERIFERAGPAFAERSTISLKYLLVALTTLVNSAQRDRKTAL